MQSDLPIEHVLPIPNVQLVNHSNFLQTHISHLLHLTCLLYVFIFFPPTERKNTHLVSTTELFTSVGLKSPKVFPVAPTWPVRPGGKLGSWLICTTCAVHSTPDPGSSFNWNSPGIPRTKDLVTHIDTYHSPKRIETSFPACKWVVENKFKYKNMVETTGTRQGKQKLSMIEVKFLRYLRPVHAYRLWRSPHQGDLSRRGIDARKGANKLKEGLKIPVGRLVLVASLENGNLFQLSVDL